MSVAINGAYDFARYIMKNKHNDLINTGLNVLNVVSLYQLEQEHNSELLCQSSLYTNTILQLYSEVTEFMTEDALKAVRLYEKLSVGMGNMDVLKFSLHTMHLPSYSKDVNDIFEGICRSFLLFAYTWLLNSSKDKGVDNECKV